MQMLLQSPGQEMELQKAHVLLGAMNLVQVFLMASDLDLGWNFSSINSQMPLDLPCRKGCSSSQENLLKDRNPSKAIFDVHIHTRTS